MCVRVSLIWVKFVGVKFPVDTVGLGKLLRKVFKESFWREQAPCITKIFNVKEICFNKNIGQISFGEPKVTMPLF